MKKKWSILIAVILALAAVAGGWYYYSSHKTKAVNYTLGTVGRGNISVEIDATGTIKPVNSVDLSATVSGTLQKVLVKQNDHVTTGQTIAVINSKALTSTLQQAQDTLENKESYYNRIKALYDQNAVSYQEMENARLDYLTSQSSFDKAQADVDDTVITAPMDGYIIGEPMEVGETVSQGLSSQMIIATVADLSSMQIKLLVDETDIGEVSRGEAVTFTVDAYPNREFHGTVRDISKKEYSSSSSSSSSSTSSSSSSVVYYTVYVDINSDELDGLYPYMTARAEIHGRSSENALLVPTTALRSDSQGEYVYRKNGTDLEKAYVTVGITSDSSVEIEKGLSEGDQVVVSGTVTDAEAAASNSSSSRGNRPPMIH